MSVRSTNLLTSRHHVLHVGDSWVVEFDDLGVSADTTEIDDVGTHPDASHTVIPNSAGTRVRAQMGWFNNQGIAHVLVELLSNGVAIDSEDIPNDGIHTPFPYTCRLLKSLNDPLPFNATAGDSFSLRITFIESFADPDLHPDPTIEPGDASSEFPAFIATMQWGSEGYPSEELCEDVLVLGSPFFTVRSYNDSGVAGTVYPLRGRGMDHTIDQDYNIFVAEHLEDDSNLDTWFDNTCWCVGQRIIAAHKVFIVESASGCVTHTCGPSGLTEPTWPASGTVVDGNLTWTYIRLAVGSDLTDFGPWSVGDQCVGNHVLGVEGGNTNVYEVTAADSEPSTTCGNKGGSQPTWPSSGTVVDGGITWRYQHVANETDADNIIQKFPNSTTGSIFFSFNDNDVTGELQLDRPMAVVAGEDGTVWFLAWANLGASDVLSLVHLDASGAILNRWNDLEFDNADAVVFMDVSKTDKIYYMQNPRAKLWGYDPAGSASLGVVIDHTGEFNSNFGTFKLVIGNSTGGALVTRHGLFTENIEENRLYEYKCDVAIDGFHPIRNGFVSSSMCYTKNTDSVWCGSHVTVDFDDDKIDRIPLNTGLHTDEFDVVASYRIISCTGKRGEGFICPPSGGFFPYVTLIGAN